ncbi:MAG: FAD-dependent oxidoreductase, partial [Bacillota bacterium]|nr:FAD-dependent oxidoreductase [Bacillota bacterium]
PLPLLRAVELSRGPGEIPPAWTDPTADRTQRAEQRYLVHYQAAPFMLAAEEQLLAEGVDLLYSAQVSDVDKVDGQITDVWIETKLGRRRIAGSAFIDATGDADLLYFAGEKTFDDPTNRRTGWYFSYDGHDLKLHQQTDPIYTDVPPESRLYSGTDIESVSQHCIDGRKMILAHVRRLQASGQPDVYPLIIPAFHGLRMTRRLDGVLAFSEACHDQIWFDDAIGMIGNWKQRGHRYSIPYRTICAPGLTNLYAAGRCSCADKSGWDLTRVIPTCAVTGEAAGTAAALQAKSGIRPDYPVLQNKLVEQGVLLDESLFSRHEKEVSP